MVSLSGVKGCVDTYLQGRVGPLAAADEAAIDAICSSPPADLLDQPPAIIGPWSVHPERRGE